MTPALVPIAVHEGMSDGRAVGFTHEDKRYRIRSAADLRLAIAKAQAADSLRAPEARSAIVSRHGWGIFAIINRAGKCRMPVVRYYRCLRANDEVGAFRRAKGTHDEYVLHALFRCRKCISCKRAKVSYWTSRALAEFDKAQRTWLCTWTFEPGVHALADAVVRLECRRLRVSYAALSAEELFKRRSSVLANEIQLYFKRLRKAGRVLRYLLVCEVHTGERRPGHLDAVEPGLTPEEAMARSRMGTASGVLGRPHFHALVHESVAGDFVSAEEIYETSKGEFRIRDHQPDKGKPSEVKRQWSLGFCQGKLEEDRDKARYLTSYLSPETSWRVHASQRYGQSDPTPIVAIGSAVIRDGRPQPTHDDGDGVRGEAPAGRMGLAP